MLAQLNRLTNRADFMRVTRSPIKTSTKGLVGYLLADDSLSTPRIGFIIPKSVGGSVVRHRVARQLRHASRNSLELLPKSSLVVVRATKRDQDAQHEIPQLFNSLNNKAQQ